MADLCACGHGALDHRSHKGRCNSIVAERSWLDFDLCPCRAYDPSVLPKPGERLEFGVHRQHPSVAETAPAWGSPLQLRRSLDRDADRKADEAMKRRA